MAKNIGPIMTSRWKGILDVFPIKWRSKLGITQVETPGVELDVLPDEPSGALIASATLQDHRDERRKINVTIEDPTGESLVENVMMDGVAAAIQGVRTSTIVNEGTALPAATHLTLSQTQQAFGNGKSEQQIEAVTAFPERPGQVYEPVWDVNIGFVKQIVPLGDGVGDANTDSQPVDHLRSEKTVYSPDLTAILEKVYSMPTTINVDVPDQVNSLTALYEQSMGAGAYVQEGEGQALGTSAVLSLSPNGRATGSVAVIPDILIDDTIFNGSNLDAQEYYFFVLSPTTKAELITRADALHGGTVLEWPRMKPQRIRVVLKGQKTSVEALTDLAISVSLSNSTQSYAISQGEGANADKGSNLRILTVGPYIHDDLTILGDLTKSVNVSVTSVTEQSAGTNWPGGSTSSTASSDADASVAGHQLTATTPTSIPTSGSYAIVKATEPWKYGLIMCRVVVFSASDL